MLTAFFLQFSVQTHRRIGTLFWVCVFFKGRPKPAVPELWILGLDEDPAGVKAVGGGARGVEGDLRNGRRHQRGRSDLKYIFF